MSRTPIAFEGRNGKLYGDGKPFLLKGINWFGSEHKLDHPPFGLDRHSLDYYMKWLAQEKFNAVRLMFNHEAVLKDAPIPRTCGYCTKVRDHLAAEPALVGVTYTQMFKVIAEAAARHGVLVMLVAHRLSTTNYDQVVKQGGYKWYTNEWTVSRVKQSWEKVAATLCSQWNICTPLPAPDALAPAIADGSAARGRRRVLRKLL